MSKKHRPSQEKKDASPKIFQRDKLKEKNEIQIRSYQWTANQQKIIDCILDKQSRIIFINGPAGSGKSVIATYCGLVLIGVKRILSDYIFLRSPLECADSAGMGYIKGDIDDKFQPYSQILEDKLEELLIKTDIDILKNDNRVHACPTNYLRGSTINAKFCHVEESQSLTFGELQLILSRYGQYSKMIIVGDFAQSDLPKSKQGGFEKICNAFNNDESKTKGIYCFSLESQDIKRSDITAYILEKLTEIRNK